jgi:ornithine cyclodeaminase/alanine dehydrogenase-like protein (mu-crystallin family)
MKLITAEEIDARLDFPALVDALQAAFADDRVVAPPRHHHEIGHSDGHPTHLLMPAWTANTPGPDAFIGTKIVDIFPANGGRGLPSIMGIYVLQSGETGAPLALIDGARLTVWRTAATSALASRHLARRDSSHLVMIGSGALAPFLIRAHAALFPLKQVSLWNHRRDGAERLQARLADLPLGVDIVDDLERSVAEADIVSCATLSRAPLLRGAWLRPGVHVDLVGAFNLAMREADDDALARARIFIDTDAAMREGGDVAVALAAGTLSPDRVIATLARLCRGAVVGRLDPADITLFKSIGAAIEDLTAAVLVWRRATAS